MTYRRTRKSSAERLRAMREGKARARLGRQADADRHRTRALLAELLGQVTLVSDDEGGQWAEMDEPAARVALAGSLMGVVAGARNASRKRVRVR